MIILVVKIFFVQFFCVFLPPGEGSIHGHHKMVNTEIRLIIFFAVKDGESLYSQPKQDQELTVAQMVKKLPAMQETNLWVQSLGWEDPLEKETATHSTILAWRFLWTI